MSATGGPRDRQYLLRPEFLRRLEQAAIASRHILAGRTKGERRSAKRGSSVEFADFRSYTHGDDLRYVDWNAYARLDRLFLKLFMEEEDLHVYVLLDSSTSMDFGAPTKFDWGVQAAAALAYMALCSGDRVQIISHARKDARASRLYRGRGCAPELFGWLSDLRAEGQTVLNSAAECLTQTCSTPGMTFLISDLLAADWQPALARLGAARGDCCVLQTFCDEEFRPTTHGDLQLVDAETEQSLEVTMGSSVLRRYHQQRDDFLRDVESSCHRYGFSYLFALTSQSVEDVILKSLRRLQVVK